MMKACREESNSLTRMKIWLLSTHGRGADPLLFAFGQLFMVSIGKDESIA